MSWLDRLLVFGMPLVPPPLLRRLGGRYVAGADRESALRLGAALERTGYRLTYDILGEAVRDPAGVEATLVEYRDLFAELEARGLERNLSSKPTQMGLLLDEEACFRALDGLLRAVAEGGGFLRFEMEDSPTTDATLRVFRRLHAAHGEAVGCVLQAMLRRSEEDARALLADLGPTLNVRLVKGIYLEPREIAFQRADEIRDHYLRILELLLAGGAFVGVATHDSTLIASFQELLERHPAYATRCELQMLLGVQEGLRRRCLDGGLPVRVYVPYGSQWMPYVRRRLRKNPRLARLALLGMFRSQEELVEAE